MNIITTIKGLLCICKQQNSPLIRHDFPSIKKLCLSLHSLPRYFRTVRLYQGSCERLPPGNEGRPLKGAPSTSRGDPQEDGLGLQVPAEEESAQPSTAASRGQSPCAPHSAAPQTGLWGQCYCSEDGPEGGAPPLVLCGPHPALQHFVVSTPFLSYHLGCTSLSAPLKRDAPRAPQDHPEDVGQAPGGSSLPSWPYIY